MIQKTVILPEKDYSLFLEIIKRFQWEINSENSKEDNFVISDFQKNLILERREESLKNPNNLIDWDSIKDTFEV